MLANPSKPHVKSIGGDLKGLDALNTDMQLLNVALACVGVWAVATDMDENSAVLELNIDSVNTLPL